MRRASLPLASASLLLVALLSGCSGCGTPPGDGGPDAGSSTDGGGGDAGPDSDGGPGDGGSDGGPSGPTVTACEGAPTADPGAETCVVEPGTSGLLIVGDVLVPGEVFEQGAVLLDDNGVVQCVGCDCAAQAVDATKVICPDAVVSPGLINAHDHIGWMNDPPWVAADNNVDPALRWEHRHDWRRGKRGHPSINTGGGASSDDRAYGELRFILGGATSVFGSGSAPGLMRNLDRDDVPGQPAAKYETFPLSDTSGTQLTMGCTYGALDGPQNVDAYAPHVSEGIDAEARNEFLCLTGQQDGATEAIAANTAIIHGIGLLPQDVALLGARGGKLIWSPRSNVSLYGDTAQVTLYHRLGISVGLGTDWMPSGSMNMLRELRCADELNQRNFGGYFSDEDLWLMATLGSARALAMDDAIGVLAPGRVGDIAVFKNNGRRYHRAILDANPGDVALVLRAGQVLSGDAAVVDALETGCDVISDVCGSDKRACLSREIGKGLPDLLTAVGELYPLYFCDAPTDEPSCLPARTLDGDVVNASNLYEGMSLADDRDGDGVLDAEDNCPDIFNPRRPLDDGSQGDADGDAQGDVCDPCPLDPGTADCQVFDPNDLDGDGVPTLDDNCPNDANADQADADSDDKGDVCDPCPDDANPGDAGCPAVVYDVKTDATLVGKRVAMADMVVTAVVYNGFFAQLDPMSTDYTGPEHSGIFVYLGDMAAMPAQWDVVSVAGADVASFFNQIQLTNATWTSVGTHDAIAPRALTANEVVQAVTDGSASPFEGLLVEVADVAVTNPTPAAGPGDIGENEFEIEGGFRVDDVIYLIDPQPVLGERFTRIAGPLAWRNNYLKLLPRDAGDVGLGEPEVVSFGPAPAFVREGATGAIGGDLVVEVARDVAADLVIDVASDDESVALVTGGTVTISAGTRSAVVPVEGVAAGETVLRASRQGSAIEASLPVRVIGAAEAPTLVSLTPAQATVAVSGSLTFTVALDIPAAAGGAEVTLTTTGGVGTVPATVTVAADTRTATFDLAASAMPSDGEVQASLGGTTLTATVAVVDPSELSLDLSGWQLLQANSSGSFTFPQGTAVAIGGYVILARDASKADFETFWGVTLADNVVFLSSGNTLPQLNGDETYTLTDGANTVDGPTLAVQSGNSYQRNVPVAPAGETTSWTQAASTSATPGAGQTPNATPAGIYISEMSDASGTGAYVYEFVELYYDAPLP